VTELDLIKKKIRQKMNELADDLAMGNAKDFAEYRFYVGMIAGFAMIERDILDLEDRKDND
jgi:hypothetical protein